MKANRGTPTVVFVDHTRWVCFTHLASAVRRAGFRAIRVTSSTGRFAAMFDRLVYHRVIRLAEPAQIAQLGAILRGENVVDVNITEVMCAALPTEPDPLLPPALAADLASRRRFLDKFEVSRTLSAAGVGAPPVLDAADASAGQAAEELGLPLVVKTRIGAGGAGVRIVDSVDAAASAATELAASGQRVFFEKFVKGEMVGYSTIRRDGAPVREIVARTVRAGADHGPPQLLQAVDDASLREFGRAACTALDVTGPANLGLVRDGAGEVWLIDANLRVWGSIVSMRQVGPDFAADYLYAIGLAPVPGPDAELRGEGVFSVFPTVLDDDLAALRIRRVAGAFRREGRTYRQWLGRRYWLTELGFVVGRVGSGIAKRAARRVS